MINYQDSGEPANEQLKKLRLLNETACKISNAVAPAPAADLNVLNCDGSSTLTSFASAPSKVEIIQTKPFVLCAQPKTPKGTVITAATLLSTVMGTTLIKSFAIKVLSAGSIDFSWDAGVTWHIGIDGGFSQGESDPAPLNITGLMVRPTVALNRVLILWEI